MPVRTSMAFLFAISCWLSVAIAADDAAPPISPAGKPLVEMFSAGFARGPNALKDARRHYEAAREATKGDTRVNYAFGLVLLKQLRNKDAAAHFESIAKQTGPDSWPSWQALTWMHFVAKDYPSGYSTLRAYAKQVVASKSTTDLSDRQQSAEWMGQVIAALQKSSDTIKQRQQLMHEEESLVEILGLELKDSFAAGKASVNELHQMMEEDVQQTREQTIAKQEKERADKRGLVAKELQTSDEQREALKKTAEDHKKYLDQQLAQYDKQLEKMEKEYDFLQKRALSITTSQLQASTEMNLLSTSINSQRTAAGQAMTQINQQRISALELQMVRYQVEMDQTLVAQMMAAQKAQAVVDQRNGAIKQYERATGQLVDKDNALNKWQDRLKKDKEKLKEPSTGKSAAVNGKVQQAKSFRTYVDLDLTLERDRILDSFGVAMPETQPAK